MGRDAGRDWGHRTAVGKAIQCWRPLVGRAGMGGIWHCPVGKPGTSIALMLCQPLQVGGIYFGKPRGFGTNEKGERIGYNTDVYSESEVRGNMKEFKGSEVLATLLVDVVMEVGLMVAYKQVLRRPRPNSGGHMSILCLTRLLHPMQSAGGAHCARRLRGGPQALQAPVFRGEVQRAGGGGGMG